MFCNQRAISGVRSFIPEKAKNEIETVLSSLGNRNTAAEIAFFGGSFTGIGRDLMTKLLDLGESYVKSGDVTGIRFSTRPDYIDEEIIGILKHYTITAAELGIQSMSDRVLKESKRGHTAEQTETAVKLLKDAGFSVVGQMMVGLPGSDAEDEIRTAYKICEMGCTAARVYPTVVFRDTELCGRMQRGEYSPLTVEEAVRRSADVLEVFLGNNVNCIRIGLCDSENLHGTEYAAGPNHPSMGELVEGEIYFRRICQALDSLEEVPEFCTICVPAGEISKAVGQKRCNKLRIEYKYNVKKVKFIENSSLKRYNILL
ncbi:MAG: radical SAM protein [Clostridia bacterium]|nr:radical SAM protein [Clostridia bacterium]